MKSNNPSEDILNKWVDLVKKEKVSEELEIDVQSRLMTRIVLEETKHRNETHDQAIKHWPFFNWLKNLTTGPQLGFAASFVLACVLIISLAVSTSMTSPVFASVKATLAKVSSMHYEGVMKSYGVVTMQLEIFHKVPNNLRIITRPISNAQQPALEVINIFNVAKGQGLTLMPHAKVAMPVTFEPGSEVTNTKEDPLAFVHKVLNYQGNVKELPAKWTNESFANGYQITDENMLVTLWIDSKTQLPVQVVVKMEALDGSVPFEFAADFKFNTYLENALFDLTPPTDYRIGGADEH